MPYVNVRGANLYYETHGDAGPVLLLAHGLMNSIAMSAESGIDAEAFAAKGLRVIAYEARGHGRSPGSDRRDDYHWTELAEDMHGVITRLGLERPSVMGGSMGAGAALMLALAHPDAADKLILQAPPPFEEQMGPARRMFGSLATLIRFVGVKNAARFVMLLPDVRRQPPDERAWLRRFIESQRRDSTPAAIRGVLFGPGLPKERMRDITQPALVLTHPGDAIHPLESGEWLHEQMPHAKLAVAPSMTYWQENRHALAHVVAAFVKGETIAEGLPGPKVAHQH
jgi:pimeloyl-ACP methyl ester carboxylesterase